MTDRDRLAGSWRQIEVGGELAQGDGYGGAMITVFEGDRFVVRDPAGTTVLEGRFVIDETTAPRSIDWIDAIGPDAGKTLPAIYDLTDTTLVFVAADAGMPRPRAWAAGPGEVLRRFVRLS